MGVFTGDLGAITGISNVRNWTIEDNSDAKVVVSSATRRGTARKGGIRSWNGSVSIYGCDPAYMPGDIFAFVGYRAPTTGVRGTNGIRSSGNVIVDSVQMNWNWNTNDVLNTVINFSGSGPLVHADGAAVLDATIFDEPTPCGTTVRWALPAELDVAESTVLPDVVSAQLNITRANLAVVSSSTACWTERKPGPAIDFTLAITQYNQTGLGPVALKEDATIWLPSSAIEDWELAWAHLTGITGVTVDNETGAVIQQTLNFAMQATYNGTIGHIERPGAVAWWPSTP